MSWLVIASWGISLGTSNEVAQHRLERTADWKEAIDGATNAIFSRNRCGRPTELIDAQKTGEPLGKFGVRSLLNEKRVNAGLLSPDDVSRRVV